MKLGLEGKTAIVTGGATGIGEGIVKCLAREGVAVVIADLNIDGARRVVKEVGKGAIAVKMDVSKKADVERAAKTTLERLGKIDVLVNNAGVTTRLRFVDVDDEEWDRTQNINIKGVYLMTRAVLPHMIGRRYGKIINISSMCGKEGFVDLSHYCASKFAVIGLTQSLAKEYAEYDINVNAVCPGSVRTPLVEPLLDKMAKEQGITPDEVFDRFNEPIPLRRAQTVEDIGNVVAFLASDICRNITGQGINVSGGWQMH